MALTTKLQGAQQEPINKQEKAYFTTVFKVEPGFSSCPTKHPGLNFHYSLTRSSLQSFCKRKSPGSFFYPGHIDNLRSHQVPCLIGRSQPLEKGDVLTERKRFIPTVAQHLLDRKSLEVLQLLLTEEETWKQFVAEVDLSREEEAAFRESLAEIFADPDGEDEDELQNDLQDKNERKEEDALSEALTETIADTDAEDEEEIQNDPWHKERFLDAYPRVKLELEGSIRKLHALADKVDKVHRDCTISRVMVSSSSAVSGVLTILGLSLAPVTAGVSLALSATGLGLGAAATVTSVSTSIVEKSIQGIQKCINAIQLAKANPRLANDAKRLMTTGKTSTQTTKQVKEAFGGTTLAMTKGVRIMGAATTGFFLLLDVISLLEDSKHLHEGAKSQTAAELQQQAWNLEQKLRELKEVHDSLTK